MSGQISSFPEVDSSPHYFVDGAAPNKQTGQVYLSAEVQDLT
jgi:hypothetical protein